MNRGVVLKAARELLPVTLIVGPGLLGIEALFT